MSTSDSSKMSMQDRLRALEMKKNETRGRLQRAVKEEEANSKPVKKEHEDDAERHKQFQEKLKEEGIDPERYARLHQTQVLSSLPLPSSRTHSFFEWLSLFVLLESISKGFKRIGLIVLVPLPPQEAQEEKEGKNKRKHANAGVDRASFAIIFLAISSFSRISFHH